MRTELIQLSTGKGATLTTYLLDESEEMLSAKVRPAVLICPGGGYKVCSDREAEPIAMAYLAEGYHAFILRYSVKEAAKFPQPLREAEEALTLIRKNAEAWKVEAQKIAVCGFSAGGHLAACLGTMGSVRPDALILGYPVIYDIPALHMEKPFTNAAETVDGQTPPVYIFAACDDLAVPIDHSLRFMKALNGAGVSFESHIYRDGGHGFSLAKPVTSSGSPVRNIHTAKWFESCINWLKGLGWEFSTDMATDHLKATTEYSVDLPLGMLLENEMCKQLIKEIIPITDETRVESVKNIIFRRMLEYSEDMDKAAIDQLDGRLRQITRH